MVYYILVISKDATTQIKKVEVNNMKFLNAGSKDLTKRFTLEIAEKITSSSVKEFIDYLKSNAENEGVGCKWLNNVSTTGYIYCLYTSEDDFREFYVTSDGRLYYIYNMNTYYEMVDLDEPVTFETPLTVNIGEEAITASPAMLNMISTAFQALADKHHFSTGYEALAQSYEKIANDIYYELDRHHFYDKFRYTRGD